MFKIAHTNINVSDYKKSIAFYQKALGLNVLRSKEAADGSFVLTYLSDENEQYSIELTWLKDHTHPYNLGENEWHIAFTTDDFEAAHKLHENMGCICYENLSMGIYFINDPDGYWLEIVPAK